MIQRLHARIDLPLVAIGGITQETVGEVIRAGAAGVAVISAIAQADDITAATRGFLTKITETASDMA